MSGIETARDVIVAARAAGRRVLTEPEAATVLAAYGVPMVPGRIARSQAELEAALGVGGPPWVLKIVSPDIAHKTEVGGVLRGLRDLAAARGAFRDLLRRVQAACPRARIEGVLVQSEVEGAVAELLLGATADEQFGPVVLVGLGGILAEVLEDTALGVAPLADADARRMLGELRGARLLHGFRGRPPGDVAAVSRALVALARLAADLEGTVAEVDVNPLLVLPAGRGALGVDALVVLVPEPVARAAAAD